jgi:hypothetical protein
LQLEHRTRKLKLQHGDTFGVEKYIQEHKTEMMSMILKEEENEAHTRWT